MQYQASKTFLRNQRNLFWLFSISFVATSSAALNALHGYFLNSVFQIMIFVQIACCLGFVLVAWKLLFAWHGLTLETLIAELLIVKGKSKIVIPYSTILKLFVETHKNKIVGLKIEVGVSEPADASPQIITLQAEEASALYEDLKAKLENPWKVTVKTRVPLRGLQKIAASFLPFFILAIVGFRAFMAFKALGMRPDLGISYESWLLLAFVEFSFASFLAVQVYRRKKIFYAVTLVAGVIFLWGILRALSVFDSSQAPAWYLFSFWIYLGVLTIGNLLALFLLIKTPGDFFLNRDLGDGPLFVE